MSNEPTPEPTPDNIKFCVLERIPLISDPDFESPILKTRFVCPINNSIDDCNPTCDHYEICEGWKEIMFKVTEETMGSLVRGLFLR